MSLRLWIKTLLIRREDDHLSTETFAQGGQGFGLPGIRCVTVDVEVRANKQKASEV